MCHYCTSMSTFLTNALSYEAKGAPAKRRKQSATSWVHHRSSGPTHAHVCVALSIAHTHAARACRSFAHTVSSRQNARHTAGACWLDMTCTRKGPEEHAPGSCARLFGQCERPCSTCQAALPCPSRGRGARDHRPTRGSTSAARIVLFRRR